MPKDKIDKDWFAKKLAENNKSMRDLANYMGVNVSAISRTFSGKRKMKMNEITKIATFINSPVLDVLVHAGVSMSQPGDFAKIMLVATVNESGELKRMKEVKILPHPFIKRAQAFLQLEKANGKKNIMAAQIKAADGPLAMFDDSVILFHHTERVESSAIGSVSICRSFEGQQIIARISSVRKTGEAKIVGIDGITREFVLQTATPVLAMLP